jgi:Kef-type K+ transport system membrane component KefB
MTEMSIHINLIVITIGGILVLALLLKGVFSRLRLPSLVGYVLLGLVIGFINHRWPFLSEEALSIFDFMEKIGLIALLFSVGLKSDPGKLLGHLRGASLLWVGNVLASGVFAYIAARWLGFGPLPAFLAGVALTATSVGVPSGVWESSDAIDTDDGQLFIDVAELDDISGIVFMAILFALLPELGKALNIVGGSETLNVSGSVLFEVLKTAGLVLGKLIVFGICCFLFALFLEKPVIGIFAASESSTDAVISIVGLGIIIAGFAGVLGFSVAIGGFFAGLALSRNRDAVISRTPYMTVRDLFVPFFFVGIGLGVEISSLSHALVPAIVLLGVAFAGKLTGTAGPALLFSKPGNALTIGLSMVPRAEITMIIMAHGRLMGDWAVTRELYSAMVFVVLGTCILTPPLLSRAIERWCKK